MCDFSEKVIAWIDHELADHEAAEVEQHLKHCAECHKCFQAYKEVDKEFKAYCDAALRGEERHRVPVWVPVVSVAAVAAALLFLFFPRANERRRPVAVQAVSSPAVVEAPRVAISNPIHAVKTGQQRRGVAPAKNHSANWVPTVPTIEIAIPAEAMLAPGAIPAGVTLTAEVSLAADGSAQQLRLQP
jgi:anti-sigma factor RsiW